MDVNSREPSQNIIPFRIKGNEVGRFDICGNLGIGTSDPTAKLDVVGTVKINGELYINDNPLTSLTSGVVVNIDSQPLPSTALNPQKKYSIPLAAGSTLSTNDIIAKMSGVSTMKTQVYGVGPAQMASYGNIVVAVGYGTNNIAYSLTNPPTPASWVGIPGIFTGAGRNIAYANGTWVAVGEGTNSIAYSTMTPPVASSWVRIPNGSSYNGVVNTSSTCQWDITYGNGAWVAVGDGTNSISYSLANPPTAESWIGIPTSLSPTLFGYGAYGITFGNGTWVAAGEGTNGIAYSTRTPPTADSWVGVPLNTINDAGVNNTSTTFSVNIIYANGVWLAVGRGTNTLCYSVENPPIAGSWMPIQSSVLFGTTGRSIAYGNGTWVACGESGLLFAYSTSRIPHSSSWISMKGPTPSPSNVIIHNISFNAATKTWYFLGNIGTNCMYYSTETPPVPATWIGIPRSSGTFTVQAIGAIGITTPAFTSPVNVASLDNKVSFPVNRMIAVGGGSGNIAGADVIARSSMTPTPAMTTTITYSDDDGATWQMVPGGATNAMFSSEADIAANVSFGIGGSGGANAVAWNGEKWVAAGNGRTHSLAFSDDGGMTWTGITGKSIFSVEARDIAWNGRMWVAVGRGIVFSTAYSYDGVTWMGPVSNDISGIPINVFSYDIAGPTAAMSDISGGGNHVIWTGKMWVATGTRTLIPGTSPAAYYTVAYSVDGKSWIGVPESGADNTGFDIYAHGIAWNGRNYIATGRGTTNTLAYLTDVVSSSSNVSSSATWQGLGKTVFSVWGRGVTWGARRWMATGRGTNTVAYSTNGRNWQGCGANVFKPMRRFMAMGDTALYTGVISGQPQRGVAFTYSDDGVVWDVPTVNQLLEFSTPIGGTNDAMRSVVFANNILLTNAVSDNATQHTALMYSTDAGASWARVPGTGDTEANGGTGMTTANNGSYSLAMNPQRTRFLLGGGDSGSATRKVYFSNDGFNWRNGISNPNTTQMAWVYASMWVGGGYNRWIIGGNDATNNGNGRIMYSGDADAVAPWISASPATYTSSIISCFASNADFSVILAGGTKPDTIYRSVNGGANWTEIKIEPLSFNQVVAAYSFDNNSNDASPNQNHITNVGNVTYNTSDYKFGLAAASFNGSNYFEVANDGRFSPDNFTISFWIKPVTNSSQYQSIASCRSVNVDSMTVMGWIIYITPGNSLEFWTGTGGFIFSTNGQLFSNFGSLTNWTHVAFTMNKTTGAFLVYINGILTVSTTRIYEPNTVTNLRIGAGGNEVTPALFPVGNGTLMDDFRIYNRVLSSFEIADMMKPAIGSVRSITFAPSLGRWVAVGGNGAANTITYSTDATGTAWSLPSEQAKAIPTAIFRTGSEATRVIWDAVGGRFLVGGWNGAASIATLTNVAGMDGANNNPGYTMGYSGDGVNWTPVSVRTSDNDGSGSIGTSEFGPFLTRCREIMALDVSGDFTPINTGYSVVWNSYANRFVATGNGTTPVVYSNDGGVSWTPANQQPPQQAIVVAGGAGGTVGSTTTVSPITYTIDGKIWSQAIGAKEAFGSGGTVLALRYGQTSTAISPNGRIWVAGGTASGASGTSCLAFSQNGIRWTPITNGTTLMTNVRTIAYAPVEQMIVGVDGSPSNAAITASSGVGNGVWVAGGDTSNSLIFSYDGINWSDVPNSLSILTRCNVVVFGGSGTSATGLFVAGGLAGTRDPTANMAYSTDGLNWQPIRGSGSRISSGGASINCMTYGRDENGRGLWVAGTFGSSTVSILYSYNGIDWVGVVGSGSSLSSTITGISYGVNARTGRGLWVASVYRQTTSGYAFLFSANGRDGWTAVSNTKSGLFELNTSGATSIVYLNGVWYATGLSGGIGTGRTLAYSYEGSSGWFGVYPMTNLYGTTLTAYSTTDMRCLATTRNYAPSGAVGLGALLPVRSLGWTAGVGSAYLQHPTLIFGSEHTQASAAISGDGGRTWGASTVSASQSAFRGGMCYDAFWNGAIWAAVGYDTVSGAKVSTSKDGISWTQIPAGSVPIAGVLYTIMWNGKVWMVGGDGSPTNDINTASIAWSSDLNAWTGVANTDTKLTVVKRISWNGMYWVAVGEGDVSTIMHSRDTRGLVWEDTYMSSLSTNKTASAISFGNDVVWGGGRWVAVGRSNSSGGSSAATILYSVDTPASGGEPAEYAISGRRWTAVASSAQLFPYGVNSVCWNGKRFVATGPASSSCATSNIIAWSADGISWSAYSTTKTIAPGQRWVAVGSSSRACIALSTDGQVWTDVSGSQLLFPDISGVNPMIIATMKTGARAIGWNGSSLVVGGSRSATTVTPRANMTATTTNGRTTIPVCAFIGSGNGTLGGGTTIGPLETNATPNFMRVSSSVFITHLDVNIRETSAPWANMWLNTYTDISATQLFQVTPDSHTFSSGLKWNGWSWVANFGLTSFNPLTGEQYGSIWYCTDPLARIGWSVASNSTENPRILIGQGGYAAVEWNGVAWLACGYDPNNNNLIYTTDKYGATGWTAVSGIVSGSGSASFQPVCIASSSRFWVVGGSQGTTSALYFTNDRTGATGWRAVGGTLSVIPSIRITSVGYNGTAWICCGGGRIGTDSFGGVFSSGSISWRADDGTIEDFASGWATATVSGTSGGIPPIMSACSSIAYNTNVATPIWVVVGEDVSGNGGGQIAYTTTLNGSSEWKKPSTGTLPFTTFGRLNGIAWTGYSWIATSGSGFSRLASTTDITAATQWNNTTNGLYTPTLCTNAIACVNIPISLLTTGMSTSAGVGAGTGAMWRAGIGRAQGLLPGGGTETTAVIARSSNGAEGRVWSQVYSRNFLIAVGGGIIRDNGGRRIIDASGTLLWDISGSGGANRMAYSYDGGLSWTTNNTSVLTNVASNPIGTIRTVKYGNGIWVAGGDVIGSNLNSNCLAWSRDGVNWTGAGGSQIFGSTGACYSVCCNDRGRWVAVGGAALTTPTYIVGTNTTGSIYTMAWSDDGMNWMPIIGSRALFGIVCQGVSYGADASGVGMWTAIGRGSSYTGCAYSYDGKTWFLSQTSGALFGTSTSVFDERFPTPNVRFISLAMSSTGQFQCGVMNNGHMWFSYDSGATWFERIVGNRTQTWSSVSMSSNGQYITALTFGGIIWTSSDYGEIWVPRDNFLFSAGPITTRTETSGFPELNSLSRWVMEIRFTLTTAMGSAARMLVGSMYNSTDPSRGWGIFIGGSYQIHFSDSVTAYDVLSGGVTVGVEHILRITRINTLFSFSLQNLSTSTVISQDITITNPLGVGTVEMYANSQGETFVGTIHSIIVSTYNWKFSSVSLSSNGKYQTGVVGDSGSITGNIWTSSDYGVTWNERIIGAPNHYVASAISSTGQYQTVSNFWGNIYTSNDYGTTWTERNIGVSNLLFLSLSSTGQYQSAGQLGSNGRIWKSTNYGVTWTETLLGNTARHMAGISISSTGQYQTALVYIGNIWTSSDYGSTWTERIPREGFNNSSWAGLNISATGQYQIAWDYNTNLFISSNFGETWALNANDSRSLGIAYGKDASGVGMWVATAGRRDRYTTASVANTMAYSYDGKLWRGIKAAACLSEQAWTVAYGKDGFGVGMWVAGGYDTVCGLKWSYDGVTWNATMGASGAAVWTGMTAGRRVISVYYNGSMWLASTSDVRNGEPRGTGIAANNASAVPGYLLYSFNGKNWLSVLAPNTYAATISSTAQPSIYSVLPNPVILDFGSFYDDQSQRGATIANTTARTVGPIISNVPAKNVNTIVPYGKGLLTTGQVPFLLGGDSGLIQTVYKYDNAYDGYISGPTPQSSNNLWQYFEVNADRTGATLLSNWQIGNGLITAYGQWDNNRTGRTPFIQKVTGVGTISAPSPYNVSFTGPALVMHPDDSDVNNVGLGYKNITNNTLYATIDIRLSLLYPANNNDGANYYVQRELVGNPRYRIYANDVIPPSSSSIFRYYETIDLQVGEIVYLILNRRGNYDYDHTRVEFNVVINTQVYNPITSELAATTTSLSTSTDGGITWRPVPNSTRVMTKVNKILCDETTQQIVAVGTGNYSVATSTPAKAADADGWTGVFGSRMTDTRAGLFEKYGTGASWFSSAKMWIACGRGQSRRGSSLAVSVNGTVWHDAKIVSATMAGAAGGARGGGLVSRTTTRVGGATVIPYTAASTPLLTYTDSAAAFSTEVGSIAVNSQYRRAVVGGSSVQFVAGGRGGSGGIVVSNDGQNWTAAATGTATVFQSPTNTTTRTGSGGFDASFGTVALTQRLTTPATYPTGFWHGISLSSTGQYQSACVAGGYIYTSSDYGITWTERTQFSGHFLFVSLSSTGQYQSAVSNTNGYIYTSSDYGVSWTQRTGAGVRNWTSISLSSTGQYQSAVAQTNSYIYTSSDYGVTWTSRTQFTGTWHSVSLSSTGQYQSAVILAGGDGAYIYTSSDYGVSWTQRTQFTGEFRTISLSSTGQYQSAVIQAGGDGAYIYTSTDYGITWTKRTQFTGKFISISLSSTGQYQSAVILSTGDGPSIFTSSDYGVNWTKRTQYSDNFAFISLSSSGQYQTAVAYQGNFNIYTSTDFGVTWVRRSTTTRTNAFTRVRSSASGQYQLATSGPGGDYNGQVYISSDYGQSWMPRCGLGSWLGGTVSASGAIMMATSLLSPSTTVKRWMFIKLQDYVNEYVNFVPIPENNSISLHLNFRYHHVTLNSLDNGSWGGEVYIWDMHDLPNPSVIYISFEVANGWKIEYAVNGVPKVVTFPNRLGITSIDNINNNYVSNFGSTAIITGPLNNALLRSTDYGNTFSEVPITALSGNAYWRAIAATNSAATQTAVAYGGAMYRSFDYGATWSNAGITIDGSANANMVTPRNWQDIAISAETGAVQVSCVSNGLLYVSSNTGATWVSSSLVIDGSGTQTTNRMWQAVAVSANGQYAIACVNSSSASGYLYLSTNSGVSWVSSSIIIDGQPTQTTNQLWQDVAMSANGKYQVACVGSSGYIYYSKNYGANWSSLVTAGSRAWSSVSLSENGSTISATTNDSTGGVWVYTMPQQQYNHPTLVMNAGGGAPTTTPATVRAIAYGNSGTGAAVDGYWVAGADASANTLAYSSNGIDWTAVVGSKTTLFNTVNGVAYGADTSGTPMWVATGLPFVGSVPGVSAYSIAYSYNMTVWTGVMNTFNFTGQGNHVAYGEDEFGAGIWVAVGQGDGVLSENLGNSAFGNGNGVGATIFYSYDGANWAAATGAGVFAVSGTDVSWGVDASGIATWVATGIGYTDPNTGVFLPGGQVAHSRNGKVWAPIRAPAAISPALTPTTLATRGGVMVRPPTSTGVVPSTIGNTWRMLGGDIDGEAPDDNSGYSVSVSADGQIVAIASSGNDANGIDSGQVRVYRYNPNKTVAQTKQNLPGFGPVGWDRLGEDIDGEGAYQQSLYHRRSVSLSSDGTTLAIGTDANNGNGYYSGSVRVYKYTPNKTVAVSNQYDPLFGPAGWTRMGEDIDGEAVSNSSGWSVSLSADGTIVAIGALNNSDAGASAGHVRVYKYTPSKTVAVTNQTDASFGPIGWTRLGADIDGEAADNGSGVSVELSADGTTVAIGAHRNNNLQGHVRVYKYSASKTSAQMNQTLPNFGPIGWNRVGEDIDGVENLYINNGPITIPTLDITSFPVLNTIQRWNIDISFTVTGGPGTWRALVGNTYYNSAVERGWGIWVSEQNGIHFEHNTNSTRFNAFASNVALNVPYTLKVMKDETNTTLQLFNVSTQTMLTHTAATLTDPLGIGPVSIGGWKQVPGENFPGTISYVRVYSHSLSVSGVSVSLSADGSIVAIGGTNNDDVGLDKGYVRVFKNNPSKVSPNLIGPAGWDRVGGNIYGENNFDYSGSGIQLSADGMTIAIGATGNDSALSGYQQTGHVRVYKYNPTKALGITDQSLPNFGPAGWDRIGMDLDGEAAHDYSGYGVSLSSDGTTVVIGSVWNDNGGNKSGHTRVYKLDMYGALTYTSSNPSVADIYGNTVLLIKDGASGTTTITATQDAVSPFTVAPTTIQGTLTVSGTTYTLVYDTIYPIYTPFTDASSGDTITVAYGRAGAQGSGAPLWMVGGSGGTNVFAMSNSPMRHGSWSVVGSGAANAPFSICNSLGYSNGVWVAGNNTNQTNLLARSVDGGANWTSVTASSVSTILAGAAAMGANSFCNYSLAYADFSNDTNLQSWVAVQGTKNFFFEGGVSAVATISSDVSAVGYSLGGGRAWWVAGGVGLSGVASIGYTTDPNGATGWTKSNSVGISNLARINAVAFSSLNLQWLAVGVGSASSPGTNILYSDALGVNWTASQVESGLSPVITLNACVWNPVSRRWITAGTRNAGVGANAACVYISTDVSGIATPWTPVAGTGAILSQVYSLAYNGTVWIAAGVPATDNGSTSTLMRTADPSGATGWHGITGTNVSTSGFDTATRSIAWNSDEQMWIATGENTGSVADASFSSIIYSRDINGASGTWRSVRESNSFCFSGEGRGITFTGEKWFAVGDTSSGSGIVATTGVNVAASSNASTASWNSVSHGTAITRTTDIAYTGRRLVVTGSGKTILSGIIYSNDGTGGPGTWNLLPNTSAGAFNDTVEGGTSITYEPSYEGSGRLIATGQSATNMLSLSADNGETWVSPSVQFSSTNTFDTTTKSLFTTCGNSVAYVGNDTLFAGGGNDVHWTGKRWVATGRTSNAGATGVSVSTSETLSTQTPILIHNNTSSVATSSDGMMWQSVRASQAPNLSEGVCISANTRIGATPLINSQIVINDFGDTEGNTEYGGSGSGIAQIDIIAELTPVSNLASSADQTVGNIGGAGNSGTNGIGNLPIPSFDTTAFTITTRPM